MQTKDSAWIAKKADPRLGQTPRAIQVINHIHSLELSILLLLLCKLNERFLHLSSEVHGHITQQLLDFSQSLSFTVLKPHLSSLPTTYQHARLPLHSKTVRNLVKYVYMYVACFTGRLYNIGFPLKEFPSLYQIIYEIMIELTIAVIGHTTLYVLGMHAVLLSYRAPLILLPTYSCPYTRHNLGIT